MPSMNGMDAFTIDDLAHELDMDDAEQKRQLTVVVGKLVNEGRLIGHTKLNENLSVGSG